MAFCLPAPHSGKIRVYSMRFCPYAERTRLVLHHKNIEHEVVNIDPLQKPSWFWDRNPNGSVPIFELDDKVIYESLICSDYVDEAYPNNKLTPSDPYRRAQDRIIVELFSKVGTFFFKIAYGKEVPKEALRDSMGSLDLIEKALAKEGTPFFGGSAVQMVDLMLWPHAERFDAMTQLVKEASVPADRYPKFTKWIKNMGTVPAVQKCRWDTPSHVLFIETVKSGKPDYDVGL
ncbi:LOW QUALITY PROTEIN: glutathione S-transferase omega-1-like [Haliotis rubra]|uniref:LOW QUALITY PROTEIN: glutathione S-transferase omega-1-like n=1 Tax=Haliotis rubra TaxID=36100 RepID=UPI001EE58649|nr:LOW QUALITY PROTEIN: glutathione S-transferase omega-1-like [Haliotis rubra]